MGTYYEQIIKETQCYKEQFEKMIYLISIIEDKQI